MSSLTFKKNNKLGIESAIYFTYKLKKIDERLLTKIRDASKHQSPDTKDCLLTNRCKVSLLLLSLLII